MLNRRAFLASAGMLATAGCLTREDSTNDPDPGPGDFHTYDEPVLFERGDVAIPASEHETFKFGSANQTIKLSYSMYAVDDGGPIDAIVFKQSDYETYKDGGMMAHTPGVTAFDVESTEEKGYIDPGQYVLVFDNTDAGTNAQEPGVTIRYEIQATTY